MFLQWVLENPLHFIVILSNSYCEQTLSKTMKNLLTVFFHPFFILCKNIFGLVETTANPEEIDDIIKVLSLSKIIDDCKNSLIKKRVLEKKFKFPPRIYKEITQYCLQE